MKKAAHIRRWQKLRLHWNRRASKQIFSGSVLKLLRAVLPVTAVPKLAAAFLSARRAGTTAAFEQLNKYFMLMQMPVVASQYWNMVHGVNAEEVKQDLEGLQTMRTLGRNMAFLLRCKEAGLQAGVALPQQETPVFTNFIRS